MRIMYEFTMPADNWNEKFPDKQAIRHLILKHQTLNKRFQKLHNYYIGNQAILEETERANKLVCNYAKDIVDNATSYFIGNPISYKSDEDIIVLTNALDTACADEADGDNGQDMSIYGRAYEYIYTKKNETYLVVKNLDPRHTFVVKDDSIEENELFAVYYYAKKDDTDRVPIVYVATVLTKNYRYVLNIQDIEGPQALIEPPEAHYMGEIPVIEYLNNKLAIGDFELQIPLIDAYNVLMSDRVTDKEQFIDAILAIYGTLLTDDMVDEDGNTGSEQAMKRLRKEKLLELPDSSKAEYLTRTFDESGVEILKKAIEQDIHKFSNIPCLTDEAFGGNVSGVAMEFKLLGLENVTKIKSRYYTKGLRKRLRIFSNWLSTSKGITIDSTAITPVYTRALPKNLLEISQMVSNLWGKVSKKTLLSQIPFVSDPDEEVEAVEREEAESLKQQQELFGIGSNTPPEEEEDNDSSIEGTNNSSDVDSDNTNRSHGSSSIYSRDSRSNQEAKKVKE